MRDKVVAVGTRLGSMETRRGMTGATVGSKSVVPSRNHDDDAPLGAMLGTRLGMLVLVTLMAEPRQDGSWDVVVPTTLIPPTTMADVTAKAVITLIERDTAVDAAVEPAAALAVMPTALTLDPAWEAAWTAACCKI